MYVYTYVCMYIYIYIYIYSEGAVWPVRGTTTYVSSYCYRVCIIYMCPHTTVYAAREPFGPFEVLLHMCPHTAIEYVLYICVLILQYMQRGGRVARLRYCYICVLILLCIYVCILLYLCPRTAMYVSAGASLRLGKTMKRKMRIRAVWTRVLRRL
jgi:hypothetical protein